MAEIILETRALSKRFAGFCAVDGVDLKVLRGSVHALIGPNGAGKSTMFNLITKCHVPSAGQILFKGQDITRDAPQHVAAKGIARSFQISSVFPHLSVRQNVRIALQRRTPGWWHFWSSPTSLRALDRRADELTDSVGLHGCANTAAADLSYGRKRALEIATTVALEPEMLLLDEPMAGLSQDDLPRITELIRKMAVERTVLMVEHNLSVVASLCSTITVLARGRVLAEGAYADVARDPAVRAAYLGSGDA